MKKILRKRLLFILITSFLLIKVSAQTNTFPSTGSAGIGTTTPNASALLDMESTTKGLLIPRLTTAQRNAMASPATGLLIYQTNGLKGFYYYNGTAWTAVIPKAKGWSLTGNSGTNPSTDFIGTTDNESVVFKAAGIVSGLLDVNNFNTMFGFYSGNSNTGTKNSFFGYSAGYTNTTGAENTAIGFNTYSGGTGIGNTACGYVSQNFANSANYNSSLGWGTLYRDSTGSGNTALGTSALQSNTTGYSNVAVGIGALSSCIINTNLVAIGDSALYNENDATAGDITPQNVAIGSKALYSNTTGINNTATGFQALYNNNTGSDNMANGFQALYNNTGGINNAANGLDALYYNTVGNSNTATGNGALTGNSKGNYNTADGYEASSANHTGSYNTADGYNANENAVDDTDASAFGYDALSTASHQVRIGDNAVTSIGGYANWTNISDGRVKKNIQQNVPGLAFINQLQPITYNLDLDAADKIVQPPVNRDKDGRTVQPLQEELMARTAKEQIVYTGFIAQDVQKAAQTVNYNFSGVDPAKNSKDLYGLRYAEFVVPLVKAVQELSAKNDSLVTANAALNNRLTKIETVLGLNANSASQSSVSFSYASLQQNVPNPYNQSTIISYILPANFTSAQIVVTDNTGKILKQIPLSTSGAGTVNINAGSLAAGTYNYSLLIDGKLIGTKQMVLAK